MSLPACHCLRCGYKVDEATSLTGSESVTAGSLSVCLKCGAIAKYGEELTVVPLSEKEARHLEADLEMMAYLRRVVKAIHIMQETHARRN